MCNSNPVKEALPPILTDIKRALGIHDGDESIKARQREKSDKKTRKDLERRSIVPDAEEDGDGKDDEEDLDDGPDADDDDDDEDIDEELEAKLLARRAAKLRSSSAASRDDDLESDGAIEAAKLDSDGSSNGFEDDSEEFAGFDDRIVGSSDSGTASDPEFHEPRKGTARRTQPSPSPSPSASPPPKPTHRKPVTTSTYLPSLTMGGYISGSADSDISDIDAAPAKKNRRGQRARQALAEKKFGSGAKHLQGEKDGGKAARDQGWDPIRGATDSSQRFGRGGRGRGGAATGRGRGRPDRGAGRPNVVGTGEETKKKKHRDDEGALHPSWLAAKKAKEAKAAAPFQGKKITFD